MTLIVEKPGLLATVQDLGRPGLRALGVPTCGAMDTYALRAANALVGNPPDAAALELTLGGSAFIAGGELLAAVCGADLTATLDGEPLPLWRPVLLPRGSRLAFGGAAAGCRAYVAVAGGFAVPPALGSRATDVRAAIGGFAGRPLAAGDTLPCGAACAPAAAAWAAAWLAALQRSRAAAPDRRKPAAAPWFLPPQAYGGYTAAGIVLRAMPGPAFGQLEEAARTALFAEPFRAAPASDRMGVRLSGPMLASGGRAEMLSHGVLPGAVQLPAGGRPIVLGADGQTTGGYPVIAHVASVDLPLLGQIKPGDTVRFERIELAAAHRLLAEAEAGLRQAAAAIRLRLP